MLRLEHDLDIPYMDLAMREPLDQLSTTFPTELANGEWYINNTILENRNIEIQFISQLEYDYRISTSLALIKKLQSQVRTRS